MKVSAIGECPLVSAYLHQSLASVSQSRIVDFRGTTRKRETDLNCDFVGCPSNALTTTKRQNDKMANPKNHR